MDVELHSASNYVTTLLKNTTTISNFKLKKFNKKLTELLLDEYRTIGYKRNLPLFSLYKELRVTSYVDIMLLTALNKIHLSEKSKFIFPSGFSILIFKNLVLYRDTAKEIVIYDNSLSNHAYKDDFYDAVPFLFDERKFKICNIL